MGEDKLETTDPSADATNAAISSGDDAERAIAERVAEAMRIKNPESDSAQTQTAPTDGGSKSNVSQEKVSTSVANPEEDALKLIEASTGRKFANADEARKYLSNLNSLVGDQAVAKAREAAKAYDTMLERFAGETGKSVEEVKKYFADELIKGPAAKPEPKVEAVNDKKLDKVSSEVQQLREQLQAQELLSKYPTAKEVMEDIAILARQKGVSQLEAFEGSPFKTYIEAKSREESAKSPVVTSSSRIGVDPGKVKEKVAKVMTRGSEEDKVDLVKQFAERVGL